MKIEKLTENKIRVIINSDELEINNLNIYNIMSKSEETQKVFSAILKKAEKEVDFHTDGCKLLIETFSSIEDIFVFTITKYSNLNNTNPIKKKLVAKKKTFSIKNQHIVCHFESFNSFCEFCNNIKLLHKVTLHKLAKNIALYLWKDNYYLVLRNINVNYGNKDVFYSVLSEFGKIIPCSSNFENKLLEHGKVIIRKNAINVGINYFFN